MSTDWTSGTNKTTNWSGGTGYSTDYTKGTTKSSNWRKPNVKGGYILLEGSLSKILLQSGGYLMLQ